MSTVFEGQLLRRLSDFRLQAVPAEAVRQFCSYFELLARWNARINLTAFSLDPPDEAAIDRLLIEPVLAATYVAESARDWFDFGSGGGSPAIPLKILRPALHLTMVESTAKKAAFLQEAVRTLELRDVRVENFRFEEVAADPTNHGAAELVTCRAVRRDAQLAQAAARVLNPTGRLWIFQSQLHSLSVPEGFSFDRAIPLTSGTRVEILTPSGGF